MKPKPPENIVTRVRLPLQIWLFLAAAAFVCVGLLLACGDDEDNRTIIQALPSILVECCEYHNHQDCQQVPAKLLEQDAFKKAQQVCFDKQERCLTGCP